MVRGKKFILVMLSLVMALAMAMGFAACNGEGGGNETSKLEAVPAKEATCEYEGNTAYWKDPATGKCYSDEAGEHEIAESDTVIAATGHSYSDTWSSDGTNHWHQATCEHSDKLKDRAEHKYLTWQDVSKNAGFTGKEILACTVCGHERAMTDAYQMYVIGKIASYPTSTWENSFTTKDVCSKNCLKMTYDEATGTFSAELILAPGGDEFCVYNLAEGRKYPGNASQSATSALRVQKRSTYIISWKPTDSTPTVTEHEHKFTNNYKYSGAEHWLECDSNDGAVKDGSRAAHDLSSGACVCGFSPEKCTHEDGFVFDYNNWEGATPAPDPVAEGGTLKKICPYCFKEQEVSYDIGISNQALSNTPALETDKTYYFKGKNCNFIGLHFTEAGTYTLTLENVTHGATTQDAVYHQTLNGIAFSTSKMPNSVFGKSTANQKTAKTYGLIWGYSAEGGAWFPYEDSDTYAEMKAAVEKWKAQIVINGDPNYHYDAAVGMVELTSISFTITADDVKDGAQCYFMIQTAVGTSMSGTNANNAFLAKLTKSAPAAAVAPQQVALLPGKKIFA